MNGKLVFFVRKTLFLAENESRKNKRLELERNTNFRAGNPVSRRETQFLDEKLSFSQLMKRNKKQEQEDVI